MIGEQMEEQYHPREDAVDAAERSDALREAAFDLPLDKALECRSRFIKVRGGAGTGKTEYLVRKAAALLEDGMDASGICVVVSSPDAALAFKKRLAVACAASDACAASAEVCVVTALQLCQDILGSPAAIEASGRFPRILNDAECKFVLEDIKTLGQQPSRLKEMLNYFYYQWSRLEPEEEWLLPREEQGVRAALDEHLRIRRAMLREEAAPLCAAFLAGDARPSDLGFPYVLVDDFHNLGKASQKVCEMLGTQALIVTGNEYQLVEGFDPYPNPDGFTGFGHQHEGAICIQLTENLRAPRAVAEMGNALCLQDRENPGSLVSAEGDNDKSVITQIKWVSPADELKGIPSVVRSLLASDPALKGGDVYVAAPNKVWARSLERSLRDVGLESTVALDAQVLVGDPRNVEKASMLVAYTKLNLAADESDVVAWRSWCGFDDHLCRSGAWARLETWAEESNLAILEALASLEDIPGDPFLEASVLRERYRSGREMIDSLSGKQGFGLVKALVGKEGSGGFGDLLEPVCGDEDALQLLKRVQTRILGSSFEDAAQKVRIGSYKRLQGLCPKALVVSGLIDGFMPSRDSFDIALLEEDRERELNRCRRIFYNAVTKTSGALVLSTFQKAELEVAERMKMEVRRVRMEHGKRVAMLSPSVFISESGDAVPGALSGQQYVSDLE